MGMVTNSVVKRAFTGWYASGVSFMVTLTFNWGSAVSPHAARARLREFSRALDRRRLGGRFYQFAAADRTMFSLVPEKFDAGYPHFHGLIRVPDDQNATRPPRDYPAFITDCWKEVTPSGTIALAPLRDDGALFYATKETAMNSDEAVHSFDFWSA
ncbi:hypothetical protein D3C72_669200 [compost metagenome]